MSGLAPYCTSPDALNALTVWKSSAIRPCVMVIAPAYDVGEADLIDELADALYHLRGFRDERRRHYITKRLPRTLSEVAMARFVDQAFDASEIRDGFIGVDCIDLSEWVGHQLLCGNASWERFASYVRDHRESDFVFLTYAQDPRLARNLAAEISMACGTTVLPIELEYPSVDRLTKAFVERDPKRFGACSESIEVCLAEARDSGFRINYMTVRALAEVASHEMAMGHDARRAVNAAMGGALRISPRVKKQFVIGFSGGER